MKKILITSAVIGLIVIAVAGVYAEQKGLTGNWTMRLNDEISLRLVADIKAKTSPAHCKIRMAIRFRSKVSSPEKSFNLRARPKVANGLTGYREKVRCKQMGHLPATLKAMSAT